MAGHDCPCLGWRPPPRYMAGLNVDQGLILRSMSLLQKDERQTPSAGREEEGAGSPRRSARRRARQTWEAATDLPDQDDAVRVYDEDPPAARRPPSNPLASPGNKESRTSGPGLRGEVRRLFRRDVCGNRRRSCRARTPIRPMPTLVSWPTISSSAPEALPLCSPLPVQRRGLPTATRSTPANRASPPAVGQPLPRCRSGPPMTCPATQLEASYEEPAGSFPSRCLRRAAPSRFRFLTLFFQLGPGLGR